VVKLDRLPDVLLGRSHS